VKLNMNPDNNSVFLLLHRVLSASGVTGILCHAATLIIHLLEYVCTITIIHFINKIIVPKHKFNITEPTQEHCSNETSLSVWLPKGMENQVRQKCQSRDTATVPVASQVILYREDPSTGASIECFSHCFLQPLVLHLNNPLVAFI
jgi:hypothetical protein